ncbi:hypothetical protein [Nostoc sp.]|uniref:hypothetical protein n=1 Tax=Nostoc sp. TaxID=1180 RepID=UPI002FFAB5E2
MSHCGEAAPVLAVPVVSASGSEERASGGLPFLLGLGVSPSGASGVETTIDCLE